MVTELICLGTSLVTRGRIFVSESAGMLERDA